jgi:hypothetical protein
MPGPSGADAQSHQVDEASLSRGHQDVRRFDIAVHEACVMLRFQSSGELLHPDLEIGGIRG